MCTHFIEAYTIGIGRIQDERICPDGAAIAVSRMKPNHRSLVAPDAKAIALSMCTEDLYVKKLIVCKAFHESGLPLCRFMKTLLNRGITCTDLKLSSL